MQARSQGGGCHGAVAFHLPTAESDQHGFAFFGGGSGAAFPLPGHHARHRRDPQAFRDGRGRFLLPVIDLVAAAFQQFVERFDPPAPVVPQGDGLGGHLDGDIGQQEPLGQQHPLLVANVNDPSRSGSGLPVVCGRVRAGRFSFTAASATN